MTKAEIVDAVHERFGGSKSQCAEIVDEILEIIRETVEKGETVKISGFGNFVVRQKRARPGRNPQTGEAIEITARKVLTFKASQILKNAVKHRPQQ